MAHEEYAIDDAIAAKCGFEGYIHPLQVVDVAKRLHARQQLGAPLAHDCGGDEVEGGFVVLPPLASELFDGLVHQLLLGLVGVTQLVHKLFEDEVEVECEENETV